MECRHAIVGIQKGERTMPKPAPHCRICRHCIIKRKLFGGIRLYCEIRDTEVEKSSVCKSYAYDAQKVAEIANYRDHTSADQDACCGQCTFCGATKTASGQRVRTCERLGFTFGADFCSLDFICDFYEDGGLDALINDLAEHMVKQQEKSK